MLGDYEKAIEAFNLDRNSSFSLNSLGFTYFQLGNIKKALSYLNRAIELDPNSMNSFFPAALKAHIEGETKTGLEILQRIEIANSPDPEVWYSVAYQYALIKKQNKSIEALNKAVDRGYYNLPDMKSNKSFDFMRENQQFQKVLKKAEEKHLQFKNKFFP